MNAINKHGAKRQLNSARKNTADIHHLIKTQAWNIWKIVFKFCSRICIVYILKILVGEGIICVQRTEIVKLYLHHLYKCR